MTKVDPLARPVAPVLSLPGHRAATPPTGVLPTDAAALVAQAQTALTGSLALLHGDTTATAQLQQATGRAIRAATMLKRACNALDADTTSKGA